MMTLLLIFIIFIMIFFIMIFLNFFLTENFIKLKMKNIYFECGIENKYFSKFNFSLQFYIICIIFVLFDTELMILFNFLYMNSYLTIFNFTISFLILLFIMFTLFLEWKLNTLKWDF